MHLTAVAVLSMLCAQRRVVVQAHQILGRALDSRVRLAAGSIRACCIRLLCKGVSRQLTYEIAKALVEKANVDLAHQILGSALDCGMRLAAGSICVCCIRLLHSSCSSAGKQRSQAFIRRLSIWRIMSSAARLTAACAWLLAASASAASASYARVVHVSSHIRLLRLPLRRQTSIWRIRSSAARLTAACAWLLAASASAASASCASKSQVSSGQHASDSGSCVLYALCSMACCQSGSSGVWPHLLHNDCSTALAK